jgi:predicted outer membrane protein
VTQTSLGTPFPDGLPQAKARRKPSALSSHIAVNDALQAILKNKGPVPTPTLLKAAYATIIWSLQHETGHSFDDEYVTCQVDYQQANQAPYQYEIANGSDLDLKAFAQQTFPPSG